MSGPASNSRAHSDTVRPAADWLSDLRKVFEPTSIAVCGASPTLGGHGQRTTNHLRAGGFSGAIIPINPKYAGQQIDNMTYYGRLTDYPGHIDHAILLVRAAGIPSLVEECVRAGVSSASILAGGFAEVGHAGRKLQEAVERLTRGTSLRVLGPNCLGFANASAGTWASPGTVFETVRLSRGPVAIITQSGSVGADILSRVEGAGLGVEFWVSTGNELDLSLADGIAYASTLPRVRVIAVYLETINDVVGFQRSARMAAQAGKRIIVIHPGRTSSGMAAVRSHTASLITSDTLYDAIFRQLGVIRTDSLREMTDVVRVAAVLPHRPPRLMILSSSGGIGALAADTAVLAGIPLVQMSAAGQRRLRELVPYCSPRNPIDITGAIAENPDLLGSFLSVVMEESGVELVVMVHGPGMLWPERARPLAEILIRTAERYGRERLLFVGSGPVAIMKTLTDAGIGVFDDAVPLVQAIGRATSSTPRPERPRVDRAAKPTPRDISLLDEDKALDLLEAHGIATIRRIIVTGERELAGAAQKIGLPLAAKAILPGVTHKTELGAVKVGLRTLSDLRAAFDELATVCTRQGYAPKVLIERMVTDPVSELLLSASVDSLLGPFVVVGAGGTLTEVLNDVAVMPAPVTVQQAERMVRSLRGSRRLLESRDGRKAEVREIALAIVALSRMIGRPVRNETNGDHSAWIVREIEINPFIARPEGSCAVDAVVALALAS